MNQIWKLTCDLMRLPFTAFSAGMDMITRLGSSMLQPVAAAAPAGGGLPAVPIPQSTLSTETRTREEPAMADQDLSGKDVKYVNYTIYFTKRGYEAILEHRDEDVVWYETSGPAYSAIKISGFSERAAKAEVTPPTNWPEGYPPPDPKLPKGGWIIPENDRRFVDFSFYVVRRQPRREGDFEERRTVALEYIARTLDERWPPAAAAAARKP